MVLYRQLPFRAIFQIFSHNYSAFSSGARSLNSSHRMPNIFFLSPWTLTAIHRRENQIEALYSNTATSLKFPHVRTIGTVPLRPTQRVIVIRGSARRTFGCLSHVIGHQGVRRWAQLCHQFSQSHLGWGVLYLMPLNMLLYGVPSYLVQEVSNCESNSSRMSVEP